MMSISSYSRIVLLALVGCLMHPAMAARDVRVGVYQNEPKAVSYTHLTLPTN